MLAWIALALLTLPAHASQTPAAPVPQSDRDGVIAAVQGFFDSMAKRDVTAAKRVMLAEGVLFSVRDQNGQPAFRSSSNQAYLEGLEKGTERFLERMWDPDVKIHGPIATLWTRYDFHRNGTFSHCGVDAFDLIKTAEGWKIASGMYTVERTNCPPSPLGPPK